MAKRIDPPWRFDPFRNLTGVAWGGGAYLTLEYIMTSGGGHAPGAAQLHVPWTSTIYDLKAAGALDLTIGDSPPIFVAHKNAPKTLASEGSQSYRGFAYFNMPAAHAFATPDNKFQLSIDIPAVGGVNVSNGSFPIVWDTAFGSYENNLAHPYTTGNVCSGFAPGDPRSVMTVPHVSDPVEAACIVANSTSPVFAIHDEAFSTSTPYSGSYQFRFRLFRSRQTFPVDANNNPTGDWITEQEASATASFNGTQGAITKTLKFGYSDRSLAIT